PPPPPPPGGSTPKQVLPAKGDFLSELTDPNRRKLKKRGPPPEKPISSIFKAPELTAAEKAAIEESERSELFVELLQYMESSHGNVEELADKAAASTKTARGFIYSLLRRDYLDGYRVTDCMPAGGSRAPMLVYQGMEVNRAITVRDASEQDLKDRIEEGGIVARVHMYRFDDKARTHTVDEIVLMKGSKFPAILKPFDEPEPVKGSDRASLIRHDEWLEKKTRYEQSDYRQFELFFRKLMEQDKQTTLQYQKLGQTQTAMRRMAESLKTQFEAFPTSEVREIVASIPRQIRELTARLENERGIRIRGEALKLTPEFLRTLDLKPKALVEAERALAIAAAEAKRSAEEEAEEERKRKGEEDAAAAAAAAAAVPVFSYKSLIDKAKERGNVEEYLEQFVQNELKQLKEEVEQTHEMKRIARLHTFHAPVNRLLRSRSP
ncbi:hypothetical protein HK100_000562, partial [Physocladia obscura]